MAWLLMADSRVADYKYLSAY